MHRLSLFLYIIFPLRMLSPMYTIIQVKAVYNKNWAMYNIIVVFHQSHHDFVCLSHQIELVNMSNFNTHYNWHKNNLYTLISVLGGKKLPCRYTTCQDCVFNPVKLIHPAPLPKLGIIPSSKLSFPSFLTWTLS